MRSVNARGLDLRLRLPEGLDDLEITVRKAFSEKLTRGNVSLGLRLQSNAANAAAGLVSDQLDKVLAALKIVEQRAETIDLHLTASSAADVLALRGVLDQSDQAETDQTALIADLKAQIPTLIAAFSSARADEGRALGQILNEQLARIKTLVAEAALAAVERQAQVAENLQVNLKRVLDNSEGADSARVAQELAMLAVKADVAEEIDRLGAHISAALDLLAAKAPIGRRFDFLMQEFNREANTLCSKSGSTELTRIGLDLKTVIDKMREQVQNVE